MAHAAYEGEVGVGVGLVVVGWAVGRGLAEHVVEEHLDLHLVGIGALAQRAVVGEGQVGRVQYVLNEQPMLTASWVRVRCVR
jgi:L-aminopeptidase/D-esterase-like protein